MVLHFDAVSKTAEVYVNGTLAGTHVGMFADFQVDASRLLHPGRNLISVRVMRNTGDDTGAKNDLLDAHYAQAQGNAVRATTEEHLSSDLLRDMPHGFYGNDPAGIWQPVRLTITNQVKIEDVFIKPRLDGAAFEVTISNHGPKTGKYQLYTDIVDKSSGRPLYSGLSLGEIELKGGEERIFTYDIADLKPKHWTPQHPNLYDFRFTLQSNRLADELVVTSGFRTFEVRDGLFYLNGIKYWLRGANQVPSAICPDDEVLAHRFLQLMKEGHIEVTRTHTAPFNELWMRAADEEGIAVSFEGTWPWLMLENRPIPDQPLLQLWKDEMLQLMRKYRNHPSLILWTVNNEMKFYDLDTDPYRAMQKMTVISDLVREMRHCDPTRPMVYDSNYFRKGKPEKYGQAFMDTIDDGDVDDVHAYYNWYDYSLFRFFKGEFQQWFKQTYDAQHITPWPTYYALSRAMQPVLVSAEIWGRNLYGGDSLRTRVCVVNDREDGSDLKPTLLHWQVVDADGRSLASGRETVPSVRHYQRYWLEPHIVMPQVSDKQKVRLLLSLSDNDIEISKNEYSLTLAPRSTVIRKLPKNVRILEAVDSLSPSELNNLRKFVRNGGRLVLLNVKEVARQLYPEYIKGWIIPTEGDICFMEKEDDPVFEGIDPMELRYWNNNRREMPTVCHATLKTVRSENVEELAGQMKIHAYIDGGKPEDRLKRIDQMRGFTLLRIKDGKGTVLVSTMCTDKADTDPIAARLLKNLIISSQ